MRNLIPGHTLSVANQDNGIHLTFHNSGMTYGRSDNPSGFHGSVSPNESCGYRNFALTDGTTTRNGRVFVARHFYGSNLPRYSGDSIINFHSTIVGATTGPKVADDGALLTGKIQLNGALGAGTLSLTTSFPNNVQVVQAPTPDPGSTHLYTFSVRLIYNKASCPNGPVDFIAKVAGGPANGHSATGYIYVNFKP